MTTGSRSFVIGVFKDNNQAQQAIQDLLNAGFSRDEIRYSVQQGGGGIADDLVNMGIPQQEANFYNHEFEQGHTVVTVHTNNQQQAFNLLKKDGGYDFNTDQGLETNYAGPLSGTAAPNPAAANAANATPNAADARAATVANASNVPPNPAGPNAANAVPNANVPPNPVAPDAANAVSNAAAAANAPTAPTGEQLREIELRTEQLQPRTRWVQAGEVLISKQIVSEQKTIDVPVTHEEVVIEQHPVSGQVSNAPIGADENEVIRIPVSEEKVNVEKEIVVTGEVTVGTRKVQDTEQFTDTVNREELKVNREGDVDVEGVNPQQTPGQAAS